MGCKMNGRQREKTDSFRVQDDGGNKSYMYEYTTFTDHRPIAGPGQRAAGGKSYELENGSHVNITKDGIFVEVVNGRVWRRVGEC